MKTVAAGIFFLVTLASASAFAAHPLITDDTGTQGGGKYQLEINGGIGFDSEESAGTKSRETAAEGTLAVTAGVADSVDVVLSVPFAWSRETAEGVRISNGGISDVTLEAKWRFLEAGPLSFALKPGISLPTGDAAKGLGNGRVSYGAALVTTVNLEPVLVHLNLGYARNEFRRAEDRECGRRNIWRGSVAATTEVAKGLQLAADLGVESNPDKSDRTLPAYLLGGVIWSVNDSIDLDAGIKGGLTRPETDIAGLTGITYHF